VRRLRDYSNWFNGGDLVSGLRMHARVLRPVRAWRDGGARGV